MQYDIQSIIQYLNNVKIRCTYGAIAGLLNIKLRDVSEHIGERRQEVSWVVNLKNGEPTGYQHEDIYPDLYTNRRIISTPEELAIEMNLHE